MDITELSHRTTEPSAPGAQLVEDHINTVAEKLAAGCQALHEGKYESGLASLSEAAEILSVARAKAAAAAAIAGTHFSDSHHYEVEVVRRSVATATLDLIATSDQAAIDEALQKAEGASYESPVTIYEPRILRRSE